ncbi:MAG: DnaJ domain-containing protein [Salibacteraceae bacterium]|nr:DnaJ domain-containing protein [Salibacteraceae bacterium]
MYNRYYRLLGIDSNAGIEEVKRAYRKLAKTYHPDLNLPTSDREKFIEVTQAYERLIERLKRPRLTKYVHTKKSYKAKKKRRGTRHPADNANRYARMRYKKYRTESNAFTDKENFWKYRLLFYFSKIFVYAIYSFIGLCGISGFTISSIFNPLLWFIASFFIFIWWKSHGFFLEWKKDFKNVFADQ